MPLHTTKKYLRILLIILAFYFGSMGYMYVFQRNFTFQPSAANPFLESHPPFQPMVYQTPMGLNIRGLYAPARGNMPTIVYFQGNAGNLADRLYKTKSFLARGYGFALVGYRGYSGNPGQATEANFYEDARSAIRTLYMRGVSYNKMILYGESIGTGVATQMAAELPQAKALILEAPFTSTVDVAKRIYWMFPVNKMLKDRFENDRKIAQIRMPILILHGTADRTVPYELGQRLFTFVQSPKKQFQTYEDAGHGNLYDFKAADGINAFLSSL